MQDTTKLVLAALGAAIAAGAFVYAFVRPRLNHTVQYEVSYDEEGRPTVVRQRFFASDWDPKTGKLSYE